MELKKICAGYVMIGRNNNLLLKLVKKNNKRLIMTKKKKKKKKFSFISSLKSINHRK